ncbi:S-adenosyl-L-methionine-dependent methyltransferase [Phellopilus nigrolimitatus]|nr:S-adenosyl-L-methionine-dependent methyltransferase [Phellopilus nigrolimitatus]
MLPTPDMRHLTKEDYKHVYEPAEDTFIFLDALEEEAEELRRTKPRLCLEIGSGSGCVSAFVGNILGSSNCLYLCTDINENASRCTGRTGRQNNVSLDPVIASLAEPLNHRLQHFGGFDLILFNPPYVPTALEEADDAQGGHDIQGSWAGGLLGMDITNKVLSNLKNLLSRTGLFYLVAVKENDVPSVRRKVKDEQGLDSEIVLQRRAGRENLYVVKFFWPLTS